MLAVAPLLGGSPTPASAATNCVPSATQVALFVGRSYTGTCVLFDIGAHPSVAAVGLPDNSVSSIKRGNNVDAIVHHDVDFGGLDNPSWQALGVNDANLSDNFYHDLQSPPDNAGRIEDSVSALWVMRKNCVPGPAQVAVFLNQLYRGPCTIVGPGSFPGSVLAGVPTDFVGSLKVGGATRATVWAGANFTGTSCRYNAGVSQGTLCFGNQQLSSLSVGNDTTPPSLTVTHLADGQNGWNLAGPVALTIHASDAGTGLVGPPTCTDNGGALAVTGSAPNFSASVSGPGSHAVGCSAHDSMGNTATASDTVKIDHGPPSIGAGATAGGAPYERGTWTNDDVVVTFTCTDASSGVASVTSPVAFATDGADQSATGMCTDIAGHSATYTLDSIQVDKSAPTLTAARSPEPGGGGWDASDVTVSFECDDALSGVASVTDPVTISSEGADQSVTGTCADQAGNEATVTVDGINIDREPPTLSVTATVDGDPYEAGTWTTGDVVVAFSCTDAGSGVASVTEPVTVSSDGANQSVTGTCTDNAGRSATRTFDDIDIDKTAPSLSASAAADGETYEPGTWSGHDVVVSFDCEDATSGVASVSDPVTISEEGADQSVDGACTDRAGNEATAAVTDIDVDKDGPSLSVTATVDGDPYEAGTWTTGDVVVAFSCTDAGSGVASVTEPVTVASDGANQSVTGTCTDNAGKSVSKTFDDIDIDKTAPSLAVSMTADGEPYEPGTWSEHDVVVSFDCEDATSGVATVTDPITISSEGAAQSASGTCTDRAGNSATAAATDIDVDKDGPSLSVTATVDGDPYEAGTWTTGDVVVAFSCTDAGSGVASVTPPVTVAAEGANQSVTGTCTDNAGKSVSKTFDDIDIDKTAPSLAVSMTADGEPYEPGTWSEHDVVVSFDCEDATSGVASVSDPVTVSSDGADQSVGGTCADRAGNEATATAADIDIDADDPDLSVSATVDGEPYEAGTWTNGDVVVTFTCTDGGSGVASVTAPVTVTSEGANQSVAGTCTDNAGRSVSETFDDIDIDKTGPSVSASATADGEPYESGIWSGHDVRVTFDCDDALSGVASVTDPVTISSEGPGQSASGTCTDRAGNAANAAVTGINIDKNAPSIMASATAGGAPYQAGTWTRSNVIVTFACTDAGSGVASVTPPITVTTEGGEQSVPGTCTDNAGRSASTTFAEIAIDRTPPVVAYTGNVGTYTYGDPISIQCAASDALSGLAEDTCADITGPLDVGTHTFSATAGDRAGNMATASTTVTVDPRAVASVASGNWSDPAAWSSGEPPGPADIVTVAAGHAVALDAAAASVRGVTIKAGAALVFAPELTITLESSRNVVVEGTLTMRPASPAYVHTLRFVGIDERNFQGGGDEVVDGDTGLWVVDAGKLDAVGSAKTSWTRANATVAVGATSITLEEVPSDWQPGDEISIAPTEHPSVGNASWNGFDLQTITAVSGNTVTLASGVSREHPIVNGTWGAEVMNLTRNVRIEGTASGRTHVMITATVPQTITNVALRHTGPRQDRGDGITNFVLGRYGLHFHMGHHGTHGSVVDGVVVRDSGSHAFVPHMSHGITFRNTIAYDTFEEAYWWDDLTVTEDALYDHAIAALVRSDPVFRGFRVSGFELGRGTGNTVRDSVAVGVQGNVDASGFTWPESANAEPNTWEFTANVAHNNKVDGIFVWQNTNGRHVAGPFVAYRNGQFGLDHGAYVNVYQYQDGILFENGAGGIKQRALSRGHIGQLGFAGITIVGSPVAIHLAEHNAAEATPTVYRDCAFSAQGTVKIRVQEAKNPGRYDFINCDLEPGDFQIVSALPGMRIRVQRADRTAFQIDASGAVTVIARFEPPDIPPTVSLTGPTNGATFTEPASVTITADAADVDGTVAQVEFFAGSTRLGVVTGGPYSFTWENVPAGTHTLLAVATDNDTATTFSTPVTITVNPP